MGAYTFVFNMLFLACEALLLRRVTALLSRALGREFGNVKVCFDSSLTLAAALIALLAFHKLNGVREGTLVSALAVGQLVRFYTRRLGGLRVLWLGTDGTKRSEIAE